MSSVEEKRRALVELRLRRAAPPEPAPARSGVVTLTAGGTLPPFFCVHPAGGSVGQFLALAAELGPDRPFHALECPGIHDGDPPGSVGALAERYLADVRAVAPHGPYLLGGWSFGGIVALELAGALRAAGEPVAQVVLLDTTAPLDRLPPDRTEMTLGFAGDVAEMQGRTAPPLDHAALAAMDDEARSDTVLAALADAGLVPDELRDTTLRRLRVFLTNTESFFRWRPRPYDGPVTLLSAAATGRANEDRWRRAPLPALRCRTVPGTHYSVVRPPDVATTAAALAHCLSGAA